MAFGKEIDRWEQSEISCSYVSRFYFNVYSHHDAFRRATYYSKFDLLKLFPSSWKQGSYDGNTTFLIHHIFRNFLDQNFSEGMCDCAIFRPKNVECLWVSNKINEGKPGVETA